MAQTNSQTELSEVELAQVAGGTGVIIDDDGCELPPGDLPHDQIPRPGPAPTPCDPSMLQAGPQIQGRRRF